MNLSLPAVGRCVLSSVVRSHGWYALAPFEWDAGAGVLTRIERLNSNRVVVLRVLQATGGVRVTVHERLSVSERDEVARKTSWMLGLDQDLGAFHRFARDEPKLAHVVPSAQGRFLRSPTVFEDVVRTVLSTNTSWSGTVRMTANLVAELGEPYYGDTEGKLDGQCAFPTASALAMSNEKVLRDRGRLGYRAPFVLELARAVDSGKIDLESLKSAVDSSAELRRRLMAIKGVGSYAAANVLLLLGRYDFVPVDSTARASVSNEWYGGQPVGAAEVDAAFEQWGAWKGLVYWFWNWS
jgi:3-methyladenine DNA glycosylase/8-oxoguanine DNA glycosylase